MALGDRLLDLANAEGGGPVADALQEAASLLFECELAFQKIALADERPGHIAYISKADIINIAERLLAELQTDVVSA